MKNVTLVVMAAGIGSRFGGGIKQLEPVGPNGEIIMDYSIHDALEAGFNKVVFIIRKDLEKDFREVIGNRMEKLVETAYAFQEIDGTQAIKVETPSHLLQKFIISFQIYLEVRHQLVCISKTNKDDGILALFT